jgi:hypothetical protein
MFLRLTAGELLMIGLIGIVVAVVGGLLFTAAPFSAPASEGTLLAPEAWPVLVCLFPIALLAVILFAAAFALGSRRRISGRKRGARTERRILVFSGGLFVGLILLSVYIFVLG